MNQSSIYVLPMRTGSGTRLKVFEAMASGKAIVSTPIGTEGLPVTEGENVLLARDPSEFARAVVRLIRDTPLRRRLEVNARALADRGMSWQAATDRLEEAVLGTVRETAAVKSEWN
jgi:glycosyltransferase involved in cell wall biosynthesis